MLAPALLAALGPFAGAPQSPAPGAASAPVVTGLGDPALDARDRGLVLLDELGCVACHEGDAGDSRAATLRGPDLSEVGSRVHADWLLRFLADPRGVAPGTAMPDLLRDRSAAERAAAAAALAHYLQSFDAGDAPDAAPAAADPLAIARGRELFHAVGCVGCHAPRDGDGRELPLPDSVPLGDLGAKYRPRALRGFLLAPASVRRSGRMPDFHLLPAEAHDLESYLLARAGPRAAAAPAPAPPRDDDAIAEGRALFAELGCARCHHLDDPQHRDDPQRQTPRATKRLAELDPTRGCLGDTAGAWPAYDLDKAQRRDLAAALRAGTAQHSDEQRIRHFLAARQCTACHARGAAGGPSPARLRYFTGRDDALGNDGRIPPPLTGVGAKLQRAWLVDAIAHGQGERPYLHTRMPAFGAEVAGPLAELLARADTLPPVAVAPLPRDREEARAVVELGRELVGEQGMNCIACHAFAGERIGAMAAVDLVDSTARRLRPEWLHHFLQAPAKFRPGTLMPQFFVDGVSARPQLGGGDVARQLDAIWHYLAEGRNVRKPAGMRQPPIELQVGDEAVMLRRSVQHTGKRGISVGLPLGVSFTFDAESLALNQIWWGRFLDAAPVWSGQGSGEARILGDARVALPIGPAFALLADASAGWPAATRRELGQQFLGYDLDARQRPTFRYRCAGVTIDDAPVELPSQAGPGARARPRLRRTLTFTSDTDAMLQFRAARDAHIEDLGAGVIEVGRSLRLHLAPPAPSIRQDGEQRELWIPIPVRGGHATQRIDYEWREASK